MRLLVLVLAVGRMDAMLMNIPFITPTLPSIGSFDLEMSSECLRYPPQTPEEIGTTFTSYNGTNNGTLISKTNCSLGPIINEVFFLIHGFMGSSNAWWYHSLIERLVERNSTVIAVDWRNGAKGYNYLQAATNVQVVGRMTAEIIKACGIEPVVITIIGHSLGAHVAGFCGQYIRKGSGKSVGRIIGLDPAKECFENAGRESKLDETDAVCVIKYSSDILVFGSKKSDGKVNFFMNGGCLQPGCGIEVLANFPSSLSNFTDNIGQVLKNSTFCDHIQAIVFLVASYSVPECFVKAYPTSDENAYESCLKGFAARETHLKSLILGNNYVTLPFHECTTQGTWIVPVGKNNQVCEDMGVNGSAVA